MATEEVTEAVTEAASGTEVTNSELTVEPAPGGATESVTEITPELSGESEVVPEVESLVENGGGDAATHGDRNKWGKWRANNFVKSVLDSKAVLEQFDIIREIVAVMQKKDSTGLGDVKLDKGKISPVSHLSKRKIRYSRSLIMTKSATMSSLKTWLPTIVAERVSELEETLGR